MRTYGTVQFVRSYFYIRCEPHVRMRLKRVFERVDKKDHYEVRLSASDENARELLWFLSRYPMTMDPKTQHALGNRARAYDQRMELVAQVVGDGYEPSAYQELALPPRHYQAVAADLVLRSGGLLDADDLGLGKSFIGVAMATDPRARPSLVVTLTHLPTQWADEFQKFAPWLRVHVLKSAQPYDLGRGDAFPDVIITSWSKLSGWADVLAPAIKSVTFDEAQELRRGSDSFAEKATKKYQAARHLAAHAKFRLGLTATPIYNYGDEMFWVLNILRPGVLGSRHEFAREWCSGNRIRDPRAFGRYLREQGLMLRHTRSDVKRELPGGEPQPIVFHVDADPAALDAVQTTAAELARIILSGSQQKGAAFLASEELSNVLRQATGIAKARHVAAFVRMLVEAGEPVILYGWHHAVYALWREELKAFNPAFYTGAETVKHKLAAKDAFVKGETKILIMSLRAGAGLDGLQARCRTVVFGELDWSPGVHAQCIGRVFRDGQGDVVMPYYLVTNSGIDPAIADVLGLKTQQAAGIRDPDAEMIERLDTGNVDRMKLLARRYLEQIGAPIPVAAQTMDVGAEPASAEG